ncbi:Chaperonin_60 [Hexamita inflata]|uniref:Chaperonin 60 n=1 Tax=Hexamita inflata TaxID=28002 RepID=A0AA86U217_9EUKA|nr:Chaperonin 60 [Hexamita inflata]
MQLVDQKTFASQISTALNKLIDVVSQTLGPHGRTVYLQTVNQFDPKITKDGVSVAREINFTGPELVVSQTVQRALQRVDEKAGDGTTSATILIGSLYDGCVRAVSEGRVSLPELTLQIEQATARALQIASELAMRPSENQLLQLSQTAANSDDLGRIVYEAQRSASFVSVQESPSKQDGFQFQQGVTYDSGFISPYFLKSGTEVQMSKPLVLLSDGIIQKIDEVKPALEQAFKDKRPLLVIAADIQGEALSTLLVNNLKNVVQCCAVRGFGYGNARKVNHSDLSLILNAKEVETTQSGSDNEPIKTFLDSEFCLQATITNKQTSFTVKPDPQHKIAVSKAIATLNSQLQSNLSPYEKSELQQRIAKLQQKQTVIVLGGQNSSEKKDRVVDALNTLVNARKSGIVTGSGNTQFKIAQKLLKENQNVGTKIVAEGLVGVVKKLSLNSGISPEFVLEKMSGKAAFNAKTRKFEETLQVYDSLESISSGIKEASEAALQLIGLGGAVYEKEPENNKNAMPQIQM